MKLSYGTGVYRRSRGNLPEFRTLNMFVEQTTAQGVVMQSRKGLVEDVVIGTGPIRASLKRSGVFGGDRFTVSGNSFYRGTTLLGTITGDGVVSIAVSDVEVLVCAGGPLYSYNGTNFVQVVFPDNANVIKIVHMGGRFYALIEGAGAFYFSDILDGRAWDGADFATPESEADYTLDAVAIDGILAFFGVETVEFWAETGDANLPIAKIQQRVLGQGVLATGCAVVEDNTFFFVGKDKIVYRNGDVPEAISDDGIVEKSVASESHRLFVLEDERHKFLCLRLGSGTFAFDITTREWTEFGSLGRDNWRCGPDFGDDATGVIWRFNGYLDAGLPMERLLTAGSPLENIVQVDCLRLTCETGTTPDLSGDYANPLIEMRDSRDGGNEWSHWDAVQLGLQGDYRNRVEWRGLGMFNDPGVMFQFRVTDPVSFRLSAVQVNPLNGGR